MDTITEEKALKRVELTARIARVLAREGSYTTDGRWILSLRDKNRASLVVSEDRFMPTPITIYHSVEEGIDQFLKLEERWGELC